jgi:3'-phosphoadenosine 5'-phosphosulfate sulfotransferase (PAPS reductase)/FAD synthetase
LHQLNFNGNGKQSEKRVRKIEREALTLASETDELQLLTEKFPEGVVFSTSFSYEDQVITHLSKKSECDILHWIQEDF